MKAKTKLKNKTKNNKTKNNKTKNKTKRCIGGSSSSSSSSSSSNNIADKLIGICTKTQSQTKVKPAKGTVKAATTATLTKVNPALTKVNPALTKVNPAPFSYGKDIKTIKVKGNGNCFYNSIYQALKNKNILPKFIKHVKCIFKMFYKKNSR